MAVDGAAKHTGQRGLADAQQRSYLRLAASRALRTVCGSEGWRVSTLVCGGTWHES